MTPILTLAVMLTQLHPWDSMDYRRFYVDGKLEGYAQVYIHRDAPDESTYLPARFIAKIMHWSVAYDKDFGVLFGTDPNSKPDLPKLPRPRPDELGILERVFLDGKSLGDSVILNDEASISPSAIAAPAGFEFAWDSVAKAITIWHKTMTKTPIPRGIPFDAPIGLEHIVADTDGQVRFQDITWHTGTLSADVTITHKLFGKTTKPAEIRFSVNLFGRDRRVVARGTSSIFGVSSDGGKYVFEGQFAPTQEPVSVEMTFQGVWIPNK